MKIDSTTACILQQKPRGAVAISPDATVYEAIELMAEKNIGAILVVENDELLGIISERDYARGIILKGKSSKQTKVEEIMTTRPVTVSTKEKVRTCMELMTSQRVRHLPVIEEGKVVGIISIGDVVNWIIQAQQAALDQLEDYITGQYPG